LEVSRSPDEHDALTPETLKRLDAGSVGRHEVAQIELNGKCLPADFEQLRDLRGSQPPGQSHEMTIGLLSDSDPAVHVVPERQDPSHERTTAKPPRWHYLLNF
jgi:hypothetical protein